MEKESSSLFQSIWNNWLPGMIMLYLLYKGFLNARKSTEQTPKPKITKQTRHLAQKAYLRYWRAIAWGQSEEEAIATAVCDTIRFDPQRNLTLFQYYQVSGAALEEELRRLIAERQDLLQQEEAS